MHQIMIHGENRQNKQTNQTAQYTHMSAKTNTFSHWSKEFNLGQASPPHTHTHTGFENVQIWTGSTSVCISLRSNLI